MNPIKLVWLAIALISATAHGEWHTDRQAIMGTEINLTFWHSDPVVASKAKRAVMQDMRRIDLTFSPYIATSELAEINANAYRSSVNLSDELAFLLDKSLYFSRVSQGAFDITFASIGWYYDYQKQKQPGPDQSKKLLPAVNYELLKYNAQDKSLAFGHPELRIDLGGIAKGHAVDRGIHILRSFGIKHATLSAGGDSKVLGDKRGKPWLIGIKNPRLKGTEKTDAVITMPLSDVAISTSGDYERFFINPVSGERVHHILNPKTGKSAQGVISSTVLGPLAVDTDALSTSVFVLGVRRGLALINGMPEYDCVIIDDQGRVHYSDGLMPPN